MGEGGMLARSTALHNLTVILSISCFVTRAVGKCWLVVGVVLNSVLCSVSTDTEASGRPLGLWDRRGFSLAEGPKEAARLAEMSQNQGFENGEYRALVCHN